jgi:hypothetical protein
LTGLATLRVYFTRVSEDGVGELQKWLPRLTVRRIP